MGKIVISLTSYPARILKVNQVIESLWKQTYPADEIILWLSMEEFPCGEDDLPKKLKKMIGKNGFRIEWVPGNLKSHKKYFYALQSNRDSVVITVDDDVCYHKDMVHVLIESYKKHPKAISARNVHVIFREEMRVAPYLTWYGDVQEYAHEERMDLCAIGVGGILYPPNCGCARWFQEGAIKKMAEKQDDLWLKFNQVIDGVPVVYAGVNGSKDVMIEESQSTALHIKNAAGGENDKCIGHMVNWLIKERKEVYEAWFSSLMSRSEYAFRKERYCRDKINSFFDEYKDKEIYIYGAGKYAGVVYDFIKECHKEHLLKAFLVSDKEFNCSEIDGIEVLQIDEMPELQESVIICGVSERYREAVRETLKKYDMCVWVEFDICELILLKGLRG